MAKLDEETKELIDSLFDLYDKIKKGFLTTRETTWLLTDIIEMGGEANQEVIQQLVTEIDADGDNKITKMEFELLLKKHFI